VTTRTVHRQARTPCGTLAERGADALAPLLERGKMCHGLLLLAFFAEDVLAAIFDALALIGFGLTPTADFRRDLADLLLVDTADRDRRIVRRLDLDTLGHREVDVVAVAELQLQILALRIGAIANAGDLEHLRKALGHTRDQILN